MPSGNGCKKLRCLFFQYLERATAASCFLKVSLLDAHSQSQTTREERQEQCRAERVAARRARRVDQARVPRVQGVVFTLSQPCAYQLIVLHI